MRLIDAEALGKARIDYIVSGYANDPEDCSEFGKMIIEAPTVCDIEQIRAEIKQSLDDPYNYIVKQDAYREVMDIIDKYTKD